MIVSIKTIEKIQYNAALAITVIIDVTSKSKLCKELSFFFNLAAGFGNYVPFIKSKQLECQNTCLSLFLLHHFTAGLTCTSIFFSKCTILEWNKLLKNVQESETIMCFIADCKACLKYT